MKHTLKYLLKNPLLVFGPAMIVYSLVCLFGSTTEEDSRYHTLHTLGWLIITAIDRVERTIEEKLIKKE